MVRALSSVLVLAFAADIATACPPRHTVTVQNPLTVNDAVIERDGGIVFVTGESSSPEMGLRSMTFSDDNGPIEMTVIRLGGALTLYRPPPTSGSTITVSDDQGATRLRVTIAATTKPLAAPKIKRITATRATPTHRVYSTTTVQLAAKPPADVIALVFYSGKRMAHGWHPVSGTSYETRLGGKGCRAMQGGMFVAAPNQRITAAWVDARGRLSAETKPIVVKGVAP